MNILVVDDTADVREVLSMAFELNGHSVTLAEDGLPAIEVAQLQQFDAVIMDIGMPILDGWQATTWLRQMPGYSMLPIILFTGYPDYYDSMKAEEAGATLLLHKPMDATTLVEMTERYIKAAD